MKSLLVCTLLAALSVSALAFPPAPYYTIFGIVRDQVGQKLDVDGAEIILLSGTTEIGRAPITRGQFLDQNYELPIPIDANRPGTTLYLEKVIVAHGTYSLVVKMNGTLFYPIEVAGTLTAGKGGERVRLDLNLGEDSDGDGLPDIWEQWQLFQAGINPDEDGDWDLSLIDKNGDFDHDGVNNWLEYIAGTFAGDATEKFALTIEERGENHTRLEFFAVTGKNYTVEYSTDFENWTRVPFSIGSFAAGAEVYEATAVGIVSAFVAPSANSKQFYRLTVR